MLRGSMLAQSTAFAGRSKKSSSESALVGHKNPLNHLHLRSFLLSAAGLQKKSQLRF